MAAQCKNVYSRLAKDHRKEAGRSPRQSQLFFYLPECAPVEIAVCVVQVVTERHEVRIKVKKIKTQIHSSKDGYEKLDLQIILRIVTCVDSEQYNVAQMETRSGIQNSSYTHFSQFFLYITLVSIPAVGINFSSSTTDIFNSSDLPQNVRISF